MAKCRHRWQLRDVRAPFSGLVVCEVCHAIVRASLVSGAGQSTMRLEVLSYGHQGGWSGGSRVGAGVAPAAIAARAIERAG